MIRAALILLLGAGPAAAQDAALTCAALWRGYEQFAAVSAYLDSDDAGQQTEQFRAMAIAAGASASDADREIAKQSQGMFLLVRATVEDGDRMSRDLFERQLQICETLNSPEKG